MLSPFNCGSIRVKSGEPNLTLLETAVDLISTEGEGEPVGRDTVA